MKSYFVSLLFYEKRRNSKFVFRGLPISLFNDRRKSQLSKEVKVPVTSLTIIYKLFKIESLIHILPT